ncbi:MAG: esterase [Polaromonas sp.]|uniref:esterase n=1 Tax=Polaromonas sp. TaxID=1869339 RepID=UPI002723C346|nr:esterase [Polaromonas sp.]MDO9113799.1 esterase [Polaromonas sp.]
MTFSSQAASQRPTLAAARKTRRWAALVLAAGLGLAACGGGTSQYDPFVPGRLLVFGDEYSALTPNGRNFSVNGVAADGNIDCASSPIWVQSLAGIYGFTFAECNTTSEPTPKARMLAFEGAKVADVTAQVEAQVAAGGFRDRDLATVLAGANDILELYGQYPSLAEATLIAEASARGQRLARVVNRLVGLGVKVIVSDLPDLGLTPFALSEQALGGSFDRAALLTRLTTAFNEQLGVSVLLDGRFVGLMQAQLRFQAIGRFPPSFGLGNITTPVCTVPLPNCTTATLVPVAASTTYLWADDTRLAPGGQAQLASLAVDRAQRNPF